MVINKETVTVPEIREKPVQIPVPPQPVRPMPVDRFIEKLVEVKVQEPRVVPVELMREIPIETTKVI